MMKFPMIRVFAATGLVLALSLGCTQEKDNQRQSSLQTEVKPGQSLGIDSVPNLRDVGGYKTSSGAVVRRGLLYRSNQLSSISQVDMEKIAQLGLKNDYDLRTDEEAQARPDEFPPGVKYHLLNVLADAKGAAPAQLSALMHEPTKANEELGGGKLEMMFKQAYREFVHLPSAQTAYREMFLGLSNPDEVPALFHCTTGKDRTGWGAAALLTLLGVPREVVMADFLCSNDFILPAYQKEIDAFAKAGGDRSIPLAIFGVKAEYLEASFEEIEKRHGTIENYFADALGINDSGQEILRELYLEK